MSCNREGCDNIMCDRYNSEYGYICPECFFELVNHWQQIGAVREFMLTEKQSNDNLCFAYYDRMFPIT